ncbi:MAG: pyridoxal phosphate-dependent aminotransferase family protein [Dissulfurispiraceae bacterium]|jgi:8-amino-7-oxononanoate synthase|nr:pyridoxal phosphate-dependent aminotransferase family protein [Dissulfurispiraceae bacterium]
MFKKELKLLEQKGLLRSINDRKCQNIPLSRLIRINEADCINFSSNDYLGLSDRAELIQAAKECLDSCGFGSGASRLLSGGTELHTELEKRIAAFKNTEAALLFNSGYAANVSAIPAIASEGDLLISDEFNHASIIDGCRISRAEKAVYRHCCLDDIEKQLQRKIRGKKIVLTDSIFSMNGDIAPIARINELCIHYGSILFIDDAHATGVLGSGKGSLQHFGIKPSGHIIQMGTLSKALGSTGAFIAADADTIKFLANSARGFIFSTALPACVAAASIAALRIIKNEQDLIQALWRNRELLYSEINKLGFNTYGSQSPIIPIETGDLNAAMLLAESLFGKGIYAPAIRPPSVKTPRIRITATASHTKDDINRLINALSEFKTA